MNACEIVQNNVEVAVRHREQQRGWRSHQGRGLDQKGIGQPDRRRSKQGIDRNDPDWHPRTGPVDLRRHESDIPSESASAEQRAITDAKRQVHGARVVCAVTAWMGERERERERKSERERERERARDSKRAKEL